MEILRKNWWLLALQGLLLIVLGALVIFSVGFRLTDLIAYLGISFLAFGLVMFFWGWRKRKTHSNWLGLSFFGVIQVIVGVLILSDPNWATSVFSYTIGGWAVLMGISQFVMGFGRNQNRLLYFLNGAVSIVMGILIIYNPFPSPNAMTYLVGFYSLLLGCFLIYYSLKARNWGKKPSAKKAPKATADGSALTNESEEGTKPSTD